ncbi:MAG: bifunctional 4-hydroxy-2-oxoglutarate aldolase/2-dehydro-3-deoxy-phosphogluconate aldolase [Victivallales bacterium]|nr:bifunctional 4-hydroxy-2-oxoglutarate aldolase/2-dehydro-3-deoxy-phosphogluconate aldolase [Victivallales bacterium]
MSSTSAFNSDLAQKVKQCGIIAVLVIDDSEAAIPLAETLLENGIRAIELTLRTPAALKALRLICDRVPEIIAGVGTVLTPEQLDAVHGEGAAFAVAPGFNRRVVEQAAKRGLSFAPGIMTPSDIEAALEMNCRLLKFFPAETSGGIKHLKSITAPYQHHNLSFIPLGGINLDNLAAYAGSPLVAAIGGSWIALRGLIAAKDWKTIGKNAAEAAAAVKLARRQ